MQLSKLNQQNYLVKNQKSTSPPPARFLIIILPFFLSFPALAAPQAVMVRSNSGSGFFVDRDGHVLTNNHVVRGCRNAVVSGAVPEAMASIEARDEQADLALLKTGATPPAAGALREEHFPLAAGDAIVSVGFPGGRGPVTREATIRDTKGPLGEKKWIQFTDSIAHGNSGGPLLDQSGNVVGVAAAKTDLYLINMGNMQKEKLAKVDLAVSLPAVKDFLSHHGVRWREDKPNGILAAHRLEDRAREYIVQVRCRQE